MQASKRIKNGQLLLKSLSKAQRPWHQTGPRSSYSVPDYKYFSGLFEELLQMQQTYGKLPGQALESLRKALVSDLRFEAEGLESWKGCLFELTSSLALFWSFVFLASHLGELEVPKELLLTIFTFQGFTFALTQTLLSRVRRSAGGPSAHLFRSLFSLMTLSRSMVPQRECIKRAQVYKAVEAIPCDHTLFPLIEGLTSEIKSWLDGGSTFGESLDYLTEEALFQHQIILRRMHSKEKGFNFLGVALAVLPSFFAYIFGLFSSILA